MSGKEKLRKGDITEAAFIKKFMELGVRVSDTCTDNYRYDLVIDIDGTLYRVNCKTAFDCGANDSIKIFLQNKSYRAGGETRVKEYESDEIDYVAARYPNDESYYLINIDDVGSQSFNISRKDPEIMRGCNKSRANLARDYKIEKMIEDLSE